jgi:hypothetical protein
LYRDLLALLNSARVDLLDQPRLINQLIGLERRVARGGRDSIDHAPGAHDDCANAVAGLAAIANNCSQYDDHYIGWMKDGDNAITKLWKYQQFQAYMRSNGMP